MGFFRMYIPAHDGVYPYVIGTSLHGWHADFDLVNPYYLSALSVGIVLTLLTEAGKKNRKIRPVVTGIMAVSVMFSVSPPYPIWYISLFTITCSRRKI